MAIKPNWLHLHGFVLVVLCGCLINHWLQIRELAVQSASSSLANSVETLVGQQDTLRADVDTLSSSRFVTAVQREADQQALSEQIAALIKPADDSSQWLSLQADISALNSDVGAVQQELDALKTRLEQPAAPPATPTNERKPSPVKTRSLKTPFTVVAIEYRGGESFLAVSPAHSTQLDDIQLLRPGTSLEGWQLHSLESGKATFSSPDGRQQSLSVR